MAREELLFSMRAPWLSYYSGINRLGMNSANELTGRSLWKGRDPHTMEVLVFKFRKRLLPNICFSEYKVVSLWLESQEETTVLTVFKKSGC